MTGTVRIERVEDGHLYAVTPLDALAGGTGGTGGTDDTSGTSGTGPSVLDAAPGVDVAVLEVAGGHLTWSVLALEAAPMAVLDDPARAQDWLWAVYGEDVAIALDGLVSGTESTDHLVVGTSPALPQLLASAKRLAFAHWAARWWPASLIDTVPPLDEGVLEEEIGELTEECDLLVGADTWDEYGHGHGEGYEYEYGEGTAPAHHRPHTAPRATDYALAAGPSTATGTGSGAGTGSAAEADALTLARGTGGSDWRRYPPGLIDASEHAVSWEVVRAAARTTVTVRAVAAPGPASLDPGLTPRATVGGAAHPLDVGLRLVDDLWLGSAGLPDVRTGELTVDIHLPGFGTPPRAPHEDRSAQQAVRARVRDFVRNRLAGAPTSAPLLRAEIAAAADDESDF